MRKRSASIYSYAIRSIIWLCVTGWLLGLAGALAERDWLIRLGTGLFLLGFAVWGLANGGGFLWGFVRTVRKSGFRVFVEQPWSSAFYVLFMVFLLYMGGTFIWLMLRPYSK